MSVKPLVFDIRTAAELLGCSDRWLKIQLRSGRFPGRKITKRWCLSEEDINAILQMSAVRGGSDV
jgi:Helix-turn-helix domain